MNLKKFISSFKYYLLFIIIEIFLISAINYFESYRTGIEFIFKKYVKFEFILIVIVSLSFLLLLKKKFTSYLFVLIPVLIFYTISNEYFLYFNRILKFSEVNEINELIRFLPVGYIVFITLFILVYIYFLFSLFKNKYTAIVYFLILGLAYTLVIRVTPQLYMKTFDKLNFAYQDWDVKGTVRKTGFLNYMLYEEAQRNHAINSLMSEDKLLKLNDIKLDSIKREYPNIHVIVLESFFDPLMLKELSFSKSIINPTFSKLFQNNFNISKTPVYAGGTAQAEFEILTGVPAYKEFGAVEFNLFTGSKTISLPSILKQLGYNTYMSNAGTQDVFNSNFAYKSLGFDKQYYIEGETYFKKHKEDDIIFDGDLLNYNLDFVEKTVKKSDKPIFNYVLGLYGHSPMVINNKRHPKIIEVYFNNKRVEGKLERIVNQYYYRTKAIGEYIEKLLKIDPKSIIAIIGDHLPNVPNIKDYGYGDQYKLKMYLINNKKVIKFDSEINHYQIPQYILNSVYPNNNFFKENSLREIYHSIIFNGAK
jgi:phosphoglycerol transferase MdoB-like AlkP superfamily enzyme